MVRGLVGLAMLRAAPLRAEVAQVGTPQGLARIEGSPSERGQRPMGGSRVALEVKEFPVLRIEAERGSLLMVGLGSGGTACPALWTWLDAGGPGFRRTEEFGTCSDLATVTGDGGTVSVTLPSLDAGSPASAFVWDRTGRHGAGVEVPQGQPPSGREPGDPDAWVGNCALDPFRASDRRGPLEAMMGPKAFREAQEVGDLCAPMERRSEWVVGTAIGHRETSGVTVAVAPGAWGAMAVGLRRPDGSRETWGGNASEPLAALAEGS